MTPLDRQLDRASRVVPVTAHVKGPACPSAHVSGHQADPDDARHVAPPRAGSALYGCTCGHSRHTHRGLGGCHVDGCPCWTYRRVNQSQMKNSARTGASRSGA